MRHKLAIGTAQFGLDYGISNKRGKVPQEEVTKILELAFSHAIDVLDTSGGYGSSEDVIGQYLKESGKEFRVVTKFAPDLKAPIDARLELMASLLRLNCRSLHGFLFHRFDDFLKNEHLWADFQSLKKEGLVQRIGFSLYHPEHLELLFEKKICFDMIQLPYSIFDRRFEKYFARLKDVGCEIHVRSVFLQGMVFMRPEQLSSFFTPIKDRLLQLHDLSLKNGLSVEAVCLYQVALNPLVDHIIIGIDSIKALEENIKAYQAPNRTSLAQVKLRKLEISDENILLPYCWPKEGIVQ